MGIRELDQGCPRRHHDRVRVDLLGHSGSSGAPMMATAMIG